MLDFIKKMMGDESHPVEDRDEELRLAATALLFRAVFVDGTSSEKEMMMVRRIVETEFGLDASATASLLKEAERKAEDSQDLYGWTRRINDSYTEDEKFYLMEKLWQVILADGQIDHHESAMMRRIAGLIYVNDADSARARQVAEEELKR